MSDATSGSPSSADILAPQQRRSRETLARLMEATLKTLEADGLDGATVPRIAAAAGVAPATVYRRFRDRDALFRAAFLSVLESSERENRRTMRVESFANPSLETVVAELVAALVRQYRSHPGLLRAFTRYVETEADEAFKARSLAILKTNAKIAIDLILTFRDRIAHPKPKRAVTLALLATATALEVRALEPVSLWRELLPISDAELQKELTRTFLAYLGAT